MGWVGPDGHEGWVVPLFADGAQGSGTSGARGVRVAGSVEQWRPDAAVVGWAAGCDCGWRGPAWTRVRPELADPDVRLLAAPGPFYDLDDRGEQYLRAEWSEHAEPSAAAQGVRDAARQLAAAAESLDEAVRAARAAGTSWADVGRAAGITRQSARERWGKRN